MVLQLVKLPFLSLCISQNPQMYSFLEAACEPKSSMYPMECFRFIWKYPYKSNFFKSEFSVMFQEIAVCPNNFLSIDAETCQWKETTVLTQNTLSPDLHISHLWLGHYSQDFSACNKKLCAWFCALWIVYFFLVLLLNVLTPPFLSSWMPLYYFIIVFIIDWKLLFCLYLTQNEYSKITSNYSCILLSKAERRYMTMISKGTSYNTNSWIIKSFTVKKTRDIRKNCFL